jgi:hypothetical protein
MHGLWCIYRNAVMDGTAAIQVLRSHIHHTYVLAGLGLAANSLHLLTCTTSRHSLAPHLPSFCTLAIDICYTVNQ